MAFYNSSVKTHIVDSVHHSNDRTEFKLMDEVYFSNLRLVGLGLTVSPAGQQFTANEGVLGLVKNAHLYSGGKVLQSVRGVYFLSAFKNAHKSNGECANLSKELLRNVKGYQVNIEDNKIKDTGNPGALTDDSTTTPESWIDLRDIFSVLKSMSYLNCEKIRNLRVVFEWRTDYTNMISGDAGGTSGFFIKKPTLICDQVTSDNVLKEVREDTEVGESNEFLDMVQDRTTFKKVTATATNSATETDQHRLNAFDGKKVNRLLMIPLDLALATVQAGNLTKLGRADTFKDEELQVILNNQNVFDYKGVDSDARKLALLTDSFGNLCTPYGSNQYAVNKNADLYDGIGANLVAKFGYYGMKVDDLVTNLQVKYTRTALAGSALGVLTWIAYGEVLKAIQYTSDGFDIVNL